MRRAAAGGDRRRGALLFLACSSLPDAGVFTPPRASGVGTFHTRLPLRQAFEAYNAKYGVTRRRYVCISFNEIRHILNLAQIIAMVHPDPARLSLLAGRGAADAAQPGTSSGAGGGAEADRAALEAWATMAETTPRKEESDDDAGGSDEEKEGKGDSHNAGAAESSSPSAQRRDRSDSNAIEEDLSLLPACAPLPGPKLICFDGDQTLYSDGANFEKSPKLAKYLYLLLRRGATIAVVTAAGYEYQAPKYELRLSGLLAYFRERGLDRAARERFYLFGGECNYLLRLGTDYQLHAVREDGPGGWVVATRHLPEAPGNWSEAAVTTILDRAEACFRTSLRDQNLRARVLRKRRSVGLVPRDDEKVPREALDETVLRVQAELEGGEAAGDAATTPPRLPFCAFNGGRDAWVDVGNKRVGVQVLQSYLGVPVEETLHIGDQVSASPRRTFASDGVAPGGGRAGNCGAGGRSASRACQLIKEPSPRSRRSGSGRGMRARLRFKEY